jgi:hypothetical protein
MQAEALLATHYSLFNHQDDARSNKLKKFLFTFKTIKIWAVIKWKNIFKCSVCCRPQYGCYWGYWGPLQTQHLKIFFSLITDQILIVLNVNKNFHTLFYIPNVNEMGCHWVLPFCTFFKCSLLAWWWPLAVETCSHSIIYCIHYLLYWCCCVLTLYNILYNCYCTTGWLLSKKK